MNHRERFDRASFFIEARLDNPPSLDEVAGRVFLTPTYFSRLFRTLSGYSVMGYARSRRLSEAARRIAEQPKCLILDIALEAGFASQQAFTAHSIRPSAYRPVMFERCGQFIHLSSWSP